MWKKEKIKILNFYYNPIVFVKILDFFYKKMYYKHMIKKCVIVRKIYKKQGESL